MAGDWLKIEKATARKPEVLRIATELGIHPDHAFGMCVRFWSWCDDQLRECRAKGVTFVTLDCVIGHTGFATALSHAGWLTITEDGISVPHFEYHLSKSAKKRAENAKRQKECRANVTKMSQQKCDIGVTKRTPEKRREESLDSSNEESMSATAKAVTANPPYDEVLTSFNDLFGTALRWTAKRKTALRARWTDPHWRENWQYAMEHASLQSFPRGGGRDGWIMDLEFFLRPDTLTKILEGKYDDREGIHHNGRPTAAEQREAGNARAFAECFAAIDAASGGNGDAAIVEGPDGVVHRQEAGTVHENGAGDLGGGSQRVPG